MDAIVSLSEFMEANEQHMTTIILYCLAVFGGIGFSINMFLDMGILLYRAVKQCACSAWRKLKKK